MRRSFALRAALAAAAVMLVASLVGSGWVWRQAETALRAQLDLALAAEVESLIREFESFGLAGLAEQAQAYARRRGPVLVLLQAPDGRVLGGRLPVPRPPLLRGYATLPATAGEPSLRLFGAVLPGGANLIVATDLTPVERAATALAWAPPIVALAAAAVALLLGFAGARRLEARLASVGGAARAIMDGDLARRLPVSGRGDEFDRLVGTVNTLIGRIETLVAAQRQVTDDIAHDLRTRRPSPPRWPNSTACSRPSPRCFGSRAPKAARRAPASRRWISRRWSPASPRPMRRPPRKRGGSLPPTSPPTWRWPATPRCCDRRSPTCSTTRCCMAEAPSGFVCSPGR
jgi:HAMP domain-containing protein